MATIAAATSTLRVAAFVLNNDLRHPAVLAQELATLDVLSDGRLDVAIGAGWNQAGVRGDRRPVRPDAGAPGPPGGVGRRAQGLLRGRSVQPRGRALHVTDYDAGPKPVQRPHPPFLIGGGGRRTLTLAAREAQIVGLAPRLLPTVRVPTPQHDLAATAEKIAWVREAAGDRFDDLELNVYPVDDRWS